MEKYLRLLKEFVSIPSVSADNNYKSNIEKCVSFLNSFCLKSGLEVSIVRGFGNPIIIAKTPANKDMETILVYGHYDVQPAKKEDGWKNEPFELEERKGKLFGRGSADNKGQILMLLFGVSDLLKKNKLTYNVKFLIEGNEETGSPDLSKFVRKYKKELTCDCIVISDGELDKNHAPVIEKSFRGVANIEVTLSTAPDDLHSGLYGGVSYNAIEELANILSKIHGPKRKILVPDFYTNTTKKEVDQYPSSLGPAIEITGFDGGYNEEGFRNSIPSKASAKINIRSAPDQNPKDLNAKLRKFILANKPKFGKVKFGKAEIAPGATLDTNNKYAKRAKQILESVYAKQLVIKSCGGTLPIVNDFATILKAPQVMIPLADQDCGAHSASEFISLKAIEKGLLFCSRFFSK